MTARNTETLLDSLEGLTSHLAVITSGHSQKTALVSALREYDRKLFFSKLPMFVVMIFISVVILYYIVTLSALAIEERRHEVALLRSRGATPSQMLAVFALEGLTVVVLAVAAGPLLAATVTSFLGLTPAFSGLTGGERLEVTVSLTAYLMSALGGVLSFAAVMAPAVQASRMNVTRQRQSAARPASTPVFQRYYIDVLLLIVSIYLFRQLGQQGSVVAKEVLGDVAVDQLLLALPGLMLVAAGMALLRLFPPRHDRGKQGPVEAAAGGSGHGRVADGPEPHSLRQALPSAHTDRGSGHLRIQLRSNPGAELRRADTLRHGQRHPRTGHQAGLPHEVGLHAAVRGSTGPSPSGTGLSSHRTSASHRSTP